MSTLSERSSRVRSTLIDHIERVDLRVRDIDSALGFYRDVVGLEVAERDEQRASLRAPGGPVFLRLRSDGVTQPAERDATGLLHIAIRFPDRASLGDALARLADTRYAIGAGDHAVSEALYIDDPDGNGVELYRDRPEDQWPGPTGDSLVPMVTLPVDLQALLADGRGEAAVGEAAAPGTDMGHVHLQVADVERTIAFYAGELGLDVTARLGSQAGFFSSNGYHHNIGANTWSSRGGSPAAPHRAGLDRVVFAVGDPEQLERLRLRLQEHGRRVDGEEGRSVIVHDPDSIGLQFVAG